VVIVEEAEEAACQLYASIGLRRQWDLTSTLSICAAYAA
jgi:hypothetical protein